MKTLIIILTALSFLQSTFIFLDLVLIILILRSYIVLDKSNFYLAFGFGLLLSHLNFTPLGFQSLIFLLIVGATHLISKSPFSSNLFTIIPITFVFLSLNNVALSLLLHQSIQISLKILLESLFSLPIYIFFRMWEERFVVKPGIKLKL